MSRKRMISPDIWTDDGFLALDCPQRLLFVGLISHADDDGRGSAAPRALKAKVFPADAYSDDDIEAMCEAIQQHTRARFYEVGGTRYYQLDRWAQHQFIKDRRPSTLPAPDSGPEADRKRTGSGPASVPNESMNEGEKAGPVPVRHRTAPVSDSRSWVVSWYREFTRRTAQTLEPGPEAYAEAAKAWKRAKPELLLASVPTYFAADFWFTKPKRGSRPEYSIRNYLAHLDEVISANGKSGASPPAKKLDVRKCPNGHNYVAGDVCMECGYKEPKEDRVEF
jgi:hypothetical protein